MLKRLTIYFSLLGLCVACTNATLKTTTPPLQPTSIQVTETSTSTPIPPTVTQPPTVTPLPPTSTPLPPVISALNINQVISKGELISPTVRKVVFSPDGNIFATGSGNETDFGIKTWRTQGYALLQSFPGLNGIVWDLAFSPDGQWIASAADDQTSQRARIWNAANGQQIIALEGPPTASSIAFSPDGTRLAIGGLSGWPNGVIWIYDTGTWVMTQLISIPGQNVTSLLFTRDGSHLISGGTDGQIRVWKMPEGKQAKVIFSGKQANRLALSPDGQLLASNFCTKTDSGGCTQGGIAIWRTSDWTILQKFTDLAESVAFSPDGSLLASGSGAHDPMIRFRQVGDWSLQKAITTDTYNLAFSPDGRLLVSANMNKIYLWGLP